jgi:GNAT superfamily N-acetyltransferase
MTPPVRIVRLIECRVPESARASIDAIFWETVAVAPEGESARAAFYDLWLGQYLRLDLRHVYVAQDQTDAVGGYLVGCWDNPATSPRFETLPYFQTFATACARYPAHLHINLTASWRGKGVGSHLVDAFAAATRAAEIPGLHVVTGSAARNVAFYTRAGFIRIAETENAAGRTIVFFGRT